MWSPALSGDRKFWIQWLKKYKSFRCLWDNDERKTADRAQINAAYQELMTMARIAIPDANVAFVKTRLHGFRSCYKREVRKVQAARNNGINYEPQLFYYNVLKFLDEGADDDEFDPGTDSWEENDVTPSSEEDPFSQIEVKNVQCDSEQPKRRKRVLTKSTHHKNHFLEELEDSDTRSESTTFEAKRTKCDEYDLFGKRIAEHFRKMDDDQSLIAEKIISEVCVYGRMKVLSMQTTLLVESEEHTERNNKTLQYLVRKREKEPHM